MMYTILKCGTDLFLNLAADSAPYRLQQDRIVIVICRIAHELIHCGAAYNFGYLA
eukprot:SAG25_NODE_730_length_5691_cov_9.417024_2_plen_55_part_00